MSIHYKHVKPTTVYVVNSRLPVYRAYYEDGIGNTIAGLFTRMAPKVAPLAKQLSMKAIGATINDSDAANVSKALNSAVEQTLASLAAATLANSNQDDIANMIAGSGLKLRRRR